jgi:hypothetical protein
MGALTTGLGATGAEAGVVARCSRVPAMRAVEVVDDAHSSRVAVVSPLGHRLAGLTLDEEIAVLRAVG